MKIFVFSSKYTKQVMTYSILSSEKQKMADIKAVKRALEERQKVVSELEV